MLRKKNKQPSRKLITHRSSLITFYFLLLIACKDPVEPGEPATNFTNAPTKVEINPNDDLKEASGLVDSKKIANHLWSHEDAGSLSELILLGYDGKVKGKMQTPFWNLDWEDIAIGSGPNANETYLYMGEIGDNGSNYAPKIIYRFPEPASLNDKITTFDAIRFKLPDGTYDCETMLFDPLTKDIFVITKWLGKAKAYRLAYPQPIDKQYDAEYLGEMTVGLDLTGGSISTDGREIIVRGYTNIYYWKRKTTEKVGDVIKRTPDKILPYLFEPQGEAVTFAQNGSGYFTLSERRNALTTYLYFYKRL